MNDIVMRLKSGREFRFKCEEYTIETFELNGMLSEFSYKGGIGECPIYYQVQDIECIAIIGKEQIEALEQVPSEDCIDRYSALAELNPLSYEYKAIKELPSVVPSKNGEWLPIIEGNEFGEPYQSGIYCSECGETLGCEANFCPNCGADMRGDEE